MSFFLSSSMTSVLTSTVSYTSSLGLCGGEKEEGKARVLTPVQYFHTIHTSHNGNCIMDKLRINFSGSAGRLRNALLVR